MAKIVRGLREGQMEFQKVFSRLCNSQSSWQVWSDFVEMTAIAISNTCEIRDKVRQDREKRYFDIIGQYSKSEQDIFPQLVGILVSSLQRNQEQDFLGEMFMALELSNHWKGQFFTPYCICKAMATINIQDAANKKGAKGYMTINDPACGAGATLIAARNALELSRIGSTEVFFVGQDIDRIAAMMCYIQLSLLGCAGYVVIADTISHPVTGPMLWPNLTEYQDAWFMPMNFIEPIWVLRLSKTWKGIRQEMATVDQEPPPYEPTQDVVPGTPSPPHPCTTVEPENLFTETEIGQLSLF